MGLFLTPACNESEDWNPRRLKPLARSDKRLGPSLKETSAECRAAMEASLAAPQRGASPPTVAAACPPMGLNIGFLSQGGIDMATLTLSLINMVGRPVIDRTGLTGRYDFTLKWTPAPGTGEPSGPPVDPDAPSVFTAVQEQLGLKLENARGPVEVVVIDRREKPALD